MHSTLAGDVACTALAPSQPGTLLALAEIFDALAEEIAGLSSEDFERSEALRFADSLIMRYVLREVAPEESA
jgi:hypothetical protein